MPEIRGTGAELVSISPQLPENNAKIAKRHKLEFDVLSDRGNALARQWGLAHTIDGALREVYQGRLKLDLKRFNGDESWGLPVPARFVLGQDGRVLSVSADPDYTRRPEPDETVEYLKQLA